MKLHIARYLTDHIELIPKTLILIALLLPDSLSGGAWDSADALREDQSSEWGCLVGSAEVSLSASTRSRFLTLNPSKVGDGSTVEIIGCALTRRITWGRWQREGCSRS